MTRSWKYVVRFFRTAEDTEPYASDMLEGTEDMDETHIANVVSREVERRGDHSATYEKDPAYGRGWRTLAIGWFDVMNREIGRYFTRSFMDELHRVLNTGTKEELLNLRSKCNMRRRRIDEIVRTPEEDRLFGGPWEFHLLCEAFFIALCDLALEDFQ